MRRIPLNTRHGSAGDGTFDYSLEIYEREPGEKLVEVEIGSLSIEGSPLLVAEDGQVFRSVCIESSTPSFRRVTSFPANVVERLQRKTKRLGITI